MAVAEVPQPSPLRRGLGAGREPAADKRHAGKGRRDERKRCWLGRRRRRWIERRRVERHPQVVQVESLGDAWSTPLKGSVMKIPTAVIQAASLEYVVTTAADAVVDQKTTGRSNASDHFFIVLPP